MQRATLSLFAEDHYEAVLAAAYDAAPTLAKTPRPLRGEALRAVAQALREHRPELIRIADDETGLGSQRLDGEITRTAFQLDFFADLAATETSSEPVVDIADANWPPAPRPDLRRHLVPLGVVAMFAASNFPFAFSVVGGDTASSLAAGCPVVVKVHPGHPRLSARVGELAATALRAAGMPDGTLGLIEGQENGRRLVEDERTSAVAFTGSTAGGRALFDLAARRARPIPFFGELGSVNPVFVTERAAQQMGDRIWRELTESFTLGSGQFCTKPGVVFAPRAEDAWAEVRDLLGAPAPRRLLNERIASGFVERIGHMSAREDVEVVVAGMTNGLDATPTLLRTDISSFLSDPEGLGEESFGPTTLIVEYDDEAELITAAEAFTGELTGTLQAVDDDPIAPALIDALETRVGRIVWNQWPTGVAVTAAMQHGGPYPASTSARDTSVGTAAMDRFLRPVVYQNFPVPLLPSELRGDRHGRTR